MGPCAGHNNTRALLEAWMLLLPNFYLACRASLPSAAPRQFDWRKIA